VKENTKKPERKVIMKKCFGIVSWFPDKEPARTQRQNRINRLFTQLNNL
jgi:hypothetical protein